MRRTAVTLAATSTAAAALALLPAGPAAAEQTLELVAQHGSHSVFISRDEPYDVQDLTTYWDFVPLDGMCGFRAPTLVLSNMTETYFVQTKLRGAAAGSATGIGTILDETFELTERAPDGSPLRVYRGTGDEYAQFAESADGATRRVNLRVVFRGTSDDGRRLDFSISARLRTDARTGEPTRFEAAVDSCRVR